MNLDFSKKTETAFCKLHNHYFLQKIANIDGFFFRTSCPLCIEDMRAEDARIKEAARIEEKKRYKQERLRYVLSNAELPNFVLKNGYNDYFFNKIKKSNFLFLKEPLKKSAFVFGESGRYKTTFSYNMIFFNYEKCVKYLSCYDVNLLNCRDFGFKDFVAKYAECDFLILDDLHRIDKAKLTELTYILKKVLDNAGVFVFVGNFKHEQNASHFFFKELDSDFSFKMRWNTIFLNIEDMLKNEH